MNKKYLISIVGLIALVSIGLNLEKINDFLFNKIESFKIRREIAKNENENNTSYATKIEPIKSENKILTISGSGKSNSDYFQTNSDKIKIVYKYKSNSPVPFFSFFVIEKGFDFQNKGGIPDLLINDSSESETFVYRKPGVYYLSISGNGKWTVNIYE